MTPEHLNVKEIKGVFRSFSLNHYDVPILVHEFVSTVLSIWLAGRILDRRRFANLGLHLNINWSINFGFGLFLGGFLISLVFLIELIAGWVTATGVFVTDNVNTPFAIGILYPLVTMVLVGIQEELTMRVYQGEEEKMYYM